jgi:AcrR family transcriptional regulator
MPKKVDHRARRATIAESVWRLTARGGIEAVTMRHVAADAGMSLGQVQHYFPGKDELLSHAYDLLGEQIATRTRTGHHTEDEKPEPRRLVRDTLAELLPLDDRRTRQAHVTFAFLAKAAVAPALADRIRRHHAALHDVLTDQLRRGQRDGTVPVHLDPAREARTLLAVLDGLTGHVLIGHHTPADAEHALDTHLDDLFSG